ncbi:RabGAP/TBC, partial [Ascoidea rubescens DSM 1968]
LLLSRLDGNTQDLLSKNEKDQEQVKTGANTLRSTFNEIKTAVANFGDNNVETCHIDWDFWSKVVNDYPNVAKNQPLDLAKAIAEGIPKQLRGMVWQLISNSKSSRLEELYYSIILEPSSYEKAIKRDLSRTRFIGTSNMVDKSDALFNIIKAYSLFDPEVGYTQGMAFIAVPLIMNMTESEAFCLLVKLMKTYGLRELFLPEMPGLHLKLYQFDRLLEDLCPNLYTHLIRQGIRSSMYASQWFLTMFAYKFPLEIVLRIYDIVVAEGTEAVLKFAIAFMTKNSDKLLKLNFDQLLEFLKDKLFDYYLIEKEANSNTTAVTTPSFNPFALISLVGQKSNVEITVESYQVDDLVADAMVVKILPITLKKYESEYEEIHRLEREREEEVDNLRTKQGQLTRQIRTLEKSYDMLNQEHVEVANEMIQGKVKIANLEDENRELKTEISTLTAKIEEMEKTTNDSSDKYEKERMMKTKEIEEEIKKTMERNLEVMEANRILEEQLADLERSLEMASNELGQLK